MTAHPLSSSKHTSFTGTARIPGDKSISHRSIMLGSLAKGETTVSGLLEGEDVLATAAAMRAMGAKVEKAKDGRWRIEGVGLGQLHNPSQVLDMGNSGTSARLLMGLVGGHPITASFTGDASLVKRPMGRVMTPLSQMGVQFLARQDDKFPLTLRGPDRVKAIEYKLPVASAQVKSAILLCGLMGDGVTRVIEGIPTRDHSENMLRAFGLTVDVEDLPGGGQAVSVQGGQSFVPCSIDVPGDPSSAAFPAVAAAITEGSDIVLPNIGISPRRNGIFLCLQEMGADIVFENERVQAGERVADIHIKGGGLKGITVPEARVPSMIDEFPALAMAAACADGTTRMTGLEELRVKESDRLLMVAEGLKACGVSLEMGEDSLTVHGNGKAPKGGALIETALDHRIAMAFLVLGGVSAEPIRVDDGSPILTSFPNFTDLMNGLGAKIG